MPRAGAQPSSGVQAPGLVQAIVPVRGLPHGKARLARLLSVDQRNRLVRAMLSDVIRALQAAARVDAVTIISRDTAARRIADQLGVGFLQQRAKQGGLNEALASAQEHYATAAALLIVPADLPLIRPADIDALVAAAPEPPSVALAPAEDGGTNGLCLRPPAVIAPAFGEGSAARHAAAAGAAGAAFRSLRSERWALDVDWPEDLARLLTLAASAELETLRCLHSPGFPHWGAGGPAAEPPG